MTGAAQAEQGAGPISAGYQTQQPPGQADPRAVTTDPQP
jgi:hypothetical protein